MGLEFSRSYFLAGGRAHGAPRAGHRRAGQWGLGAAAAGRGAAGCGYALYATRDSRSRIAPRSSRPRGGGKWMGGIQRGESGVTGVTKYLGVVTAPAPFTPHQQ
jgi:hypothetical protein